METKLAIESLSKVNCTYFITTYGCTFNQADSLKIQEILEKHDFQFSPLNSAKYFIINTCAVKNSTHTKILNYIYRNIELYPNKIFIITGCLPFIDKKLKQQIESHLPKESFLLHPHEINTIYEKLLFFRNGESFVDSKNVGNIPYRDKSYCNPYFKPKNKSLLSIPIQISEGCNNNCSYCCTTIARGDLVSFSAEQIIIQIKMLISKGVKEFFLTSQDLGNYSYQNMKLHHLLREISKIKGNVFFRLGMLNPDYLKRNLDEFLDIFEDKRFYRFIHIPIQSGSNVVLQKMRRKYKIEDVSEVIQKIKQFDPKFVFATDIITGFPTESEMEHQESLEYIRKWQPFVLNISKYSARPNTDAKKMVQIESQIIKKRSKQFTTLYLNYKHDLLEQWKGWKGDIFINEVFPKKKYQYLGRNQYYVPILCNEGFHGKKIQVQINGVLNQSLTSIKL